MKITRLFILALLLTGCTSTSRDSMTLNGHTIDLVGTSQPVGIMHQYMAVASSVDKQTPQVTVMGDSSAGQLATNVATTAGTVAGVAVPVYEGLKGTGSVTVP